MVQRSEKSDGDNIVSMHTIQHCSEARLARASWVWRLGNALERSVDAKDGDALVLAQVEQMMIAGDDGISARGQRAGDDVVIVGIVRHDAGRG